MPVEYFDDRDSPNGPVKQTGSQGLTSAPQHGDGSAKGTPSFVEQNDGTENMRADRENKGSLGSRSPSESAANKWPSAVDMFDGGVVRKR
jgi:hypothetical protein